MVGTRVVSREAAGAYRREHVNVVQTLDCAVSFWTAAILHERASCQTCMTYPPAHLQRRQELIARGKALGAPFAAPDRLSLSTTSSKMVP